MVVSKFNCKDHGSTMVDIQNIMVVTWIMSKYHNITMVHVIHIMIGPWYTSKIPVAKYNGSKMVLFVMQSQKDKLLQLKNISNNKNKIK